MVKWLRKITVCAILITLAVILELIVSNYRIFFIDKSDYETEIDALSGIGYTDENGEVPILSDSRTVTVTSLSGGVFAVRIGYRGTPESYFHEPVKLQLKTVDSKNTKSTSTVLTTYISPPAGKTGHTTYILNIGELASPNLAICFTGSVDDFYLTEVTVNPESLFSFNAVRALFLLAAIALLYYVIKVPVEKRIFDPSRASHQVALFAFCAVSLILVCAFVGNFCGNGKSIEYPLVSGVHSYNPYVQQTDAFLKGQLNIDFYPSDEFLALENPYDTSQREGLYYLWDRAYYEGEYFSYFGIAPILNVYLPYYLLTGSLPGDAAVKMFYAATCTLFVMLFIAAYVVIYRKKVSLPLLCIGILSATLSSNLLLIARGSQPFYYIATIASMSYLAAFLFFLLLAINSGHKVLRPVLFAVSGLSYAMILLARVNVAFCTVFIVLPVLYFALFRNKPLVEVNGREPITRALRGKLIDASALAAFVVIAAVFTLIYNYARFDNPFEFGTSYQLTVSDTSKNSLSLALLPETLYHYFFQPIARSGAFPFFTLQYSSLYSYGGYLYVDTGMGLFAIPLMIGLSALLSVFTSRKQTRFIKVLTASVLAGSLITAWMNMCLGGVIFRYTSDITLPLSLAATLALFSICERAGESKDSGIGAATRGAVAALMLVSCFVMLCLALSYNGNLTDYDSAQFVYIMRLFGMQ